MRHPMHYEKPYEVIYPDEIPKLPRVAGENVDEYEFLKKLCLDGLKKRFVNPIDDAVYGRLYRELDVIKEMGLERYFLFFWDFVNHGKENGVEFGPGRGAAPSSLVNYCLGITDVNPLEYGLRFERFQNRERASTVDIDIDCDEHGHDELLKYFKNHYGEAHVARVSTYKERDGKTMWWAYHASAIAVTEKSIENYAPLMKTDYGDIITYDRYDSERIGMDLVDILFLRALSKIRKMKELLIDDGIDTSGLEHLSYDDSRVYDLINFGDREGLYWIGDDEIVSKFNPESIEDLAAIIALNRPGTDTLISEYIDAKNNPEQYMWLKDSYPKIWESLKCTYGAIVYQEQIMDILSILSGCSIETADVYRRVLAKHHKEDCDAVKKEIFEGKVNENGEEVFRGCIKNGADKSFAEDMFYKILNMAAYAFNKSHAIAYAMLMYKTAYLKAYYPDQFEEVFIMPDILGENFDDF